MFFAPRHAVTLLSLPPLTMPADDIAADALLTILSAQRLLYAIAKDGA